MARRAAKSRECSIARANLRDLSAEIADIDGAALQPASLAYLASLDASRLPAVPGKPRLGPCVGGIGKVVAIGLNYADHAAETGAKIADGADRLHEGDQFDRRSR